MTRRIVYLVVSVALATGYWAALGWVDGNATTPNIPGVIAFSLASISGMLAWQAL